MKIADRVVSIRIEEMLSADWSEWFDGLLITPGEDSTTLITGTVPDQSALRGVLGKLWDLNLTILSFSFDDLGLHESRKNNTKETEPTKTSNP